MGYKQPCKYCKSDLVKKEWQENEEVYRIECLACGKVETRIPNIEEINEFNS